VDSRLEASVEGDVPALSKSQPGPPLKVLMSHAVGISAFEVRTFDDATEATSFFDDRFRGHPVPGVLAFWALTAEPDEAATSVKAEPVVIIRDTGRPGVAFSLSFVDMDAALQYLREELPLGLDPASIELYWAVSVHITLKDGLFNLSPDTPPAR
jgi:hypothetical protein